MLTFVKKIFLGNFTYYNKKTTTHISFYHFNFLYFPYHLVNNLFNCFDVVKMLFWATHKSAIKILKRVQYKKSTIKKLKDSIHYRLFSRNDRTNYQLRILFEYVLQSYIVIYKFIYFACSRVHFIMILCKYGKISSIYCK